MYNADEFYLAVRSESCVCSEYIAFSLTVTENYGCMFHCNAEIKYIFCEGTPRCSESSKYSQVNGVQECESYN